MMRVQWQNRFLFSGGLVGVSWLLYLVAGQWGANQLGRMLGPALLAKGEGKFTDPNVFIHGRFREAVLLLTAAWLIWSCSAVLDAFLRRWSLYRNARGIGLGCVAFVAVNVWLAVAGQTCLFWAPFFDRVYIDNFAQFHIKKALIPEQRASRKVMLIGNSQTNSNLDEVAMNKALGDGVWVTEMHQSGTCGFDLLMLMRDLRKAEAEYMICYVSPGYFYSGTNGKVVSQFFGFEDLPELFRLGKWSHFPAGSLRSGLIGDVLPLYRYSSSFSQRILGGEITHLRQQQFDESLNPDLEKQARERVGGLRISEVSEFEKRAFAQTIDELVAANRKLILIAGQMFSVLEQEMDPSIRPDMLKFLRGLEEKHTGKVTVLTQEEFFVPTKEDFVDLVHFDRANQARMSQRMVEILRERFLYVPGVAQFKRGSQETVTVKH